MIDGAQKTRGFSHENVGDFSGAVLLEQMNVRALQPIEQRAPQVHRNASPHLGGENLADIENEILDHDRAENRDAEQHDIKLVRMTRKPFSRPANGAHWSRAASLE